MMEIDEETQALIDQEQAAEEELAAEHEEQEEEANDGEDPIDQEEHRLLKRLEGLDRDYSSLKEEKKETVKEFNDELSSLEDSRDGILQAIEDYRLGKQRLPLE